MGMWRCDLLSLNLGPRCEWASSSGCFIPVINHSKEVQIRNRVVQTVAAVISSGNTAAECKYKLQRANSLKIKVKLRYGLSYII